MLVNKNNISFMIDDSNAHPNKNWWSTKYPEWEKFTFDVINVFSDENGVLLDIGGYVGHISLYSSCLFHRIYTFEPDEVAFACLNKNILCNGFTNIEAIKAAVYSSDGQIYVGGGERNAEFGSSGITVEGEKARDYRSKIVDSVNIVNFIGKNQISEISLIKVDIEGGEKNICDDLCLVAKKFHAPLLMAMHPHLIGQEETKRIVEKIIGVYSYVYDNNFAMINKSEMLNRDILSSEYLFCDHKVYDTIGGSVA